MMQEFTYSEYLASLPAASHDAAGSSSWTNYESWSTALNKASHGDDTYASMADKLLDQISDLSDGVPVREWVPSPFGAYPIVPEFLAGLPTPMRVMSPSGELSPVKVVVSTTCSGGIETETMTRRGVAVLALVMKLQAVRPVDLFLLVEGNVRGREDLFQLIRIDTKPLSIAHACFAMANVAFARSLTYAHMKHYHKWDGGWTKSYRSSDYESIVRTACGFGPDDLWIRSAFLHDTMLSNPVKWVNDQLARYTIRD